MLTRQFARTPFPIWRAAASVQCRAPVIYRRNMAGAAPRPESRPLNYYDEIMVDHNNIRDLYSRFAVAYKDRNQGLMDSIANTMVYEVSLHTDGEERSIYKALDKYGLCDFATHDRRMHTQLKKALAYVDTNSVCSIGHDEFAEAVEKAYLLFIKHSEEEEREHFPKLSAKLNEDQKAQLARDFLAARELAPTRPHPAAPNTGGFAQRMMDSLLKPADGSITRMREHVSLKHHHGAFM